nr:copia protein [Tanacetum cinerariifolium]
MNYNPVVAGNQSNGSASKARMKTVPDKDYILLPLWTQDPLLSSSSKDSPGDGFKPSREEEKDDAEDLENKDNEVLTANATSTKDNAVDENIVYGCADDPNMPNWKRLSIQMMMKIKRAIGTKWIYINKKYKRGIVVRNKARLVAQGYTKEEGIDYDEVFALVARIEAIRLFLAYASFKDFVVYHLHVKSASVPNIMFVVCACARFHVTPKVSHLHAVKRIFRYLKDQPKLRLWYPEDSPFDLETYADSDYAGASLDGKSTTGAENADFAEIVDFLSANPIRQSSCFVEQQDCSGFGNYTSKEESQEVGKKRKSRTPQLKRMLFEVKDVEIQGRYGHDTKINTASTSITTASINVTTVEPVTNVSAPITTVGVFVSTVEPNPFENEKREIKRKKAKERGSKEKSSKIATRLIGGVIIREVSETTRRPIVPPQQKLDPKDKDKGKMVDLEKPLKKKDHIEFDEEVARNLEAQLQDELEEEEGLDY